MIRIPSIERSQRRGRQRLTDRSPLRLESLEDRRVLDSTVVFNEIMYNPAGGDTSGEWIEFYNQLVVDIDISEWRLTGGIEYEFPDNTVVPGRGYLIVAVDPEVFTSTTDQQVLGPWEGRLSNAGEELRLYNNDNRLMNSIDYRDDGDWPTGADGTGLTLAKRDRHADSSDASNWTFSDRIGGSLGSANFDEQADPMPQLVFNEFSTAEENSFIEIASRGGLVNTQGYSLRRPGQIDNVYALTTQIVTPDDYIVFQATDAGGEFSEGDRLLLVDGSDRVLDALVVGDQDLGRSPERQDLWQVPSTPTPGLTNQFALHDDIIINEIMYHPQPIPAVPDIPPTFEITDHVGFGHVWQYNARGVNLSTGWHNKSYTADTPGWSEGPGLIGYERSTLSFPLNTQIKRPSENRPRFQTYYFQTTFEITENEINSADVLHFSHMIDDGAIFYLNGQELTRFNMPEGPIDSSTRADKTIVNAEESRPLELAFDLIKPGVNTLSAELHLRSDASADVVFGARMSTGIQVTDLIPGTPFEPREELEWIELYNKGVSTTDLSSWQLDNGIEYEIPEGTILGGGEYLVVARDVQAFRSAYPDVTTVVGNFRGSLSNHSDNVRLLDQQGNLADEVHYFEGGEWPRFADGGGSTVELIDPDADNGEGQSWAASDERDGSEWTSYTHTEVTNRDVTNRTPVFHEFIFGLLSKGEFLIDDIVVTVVNPESDTPESLLQNGDFESDIVGNAPEKWRLIGNHSGTVVTDPTDANNQVLHIVADGAQQNIHDHAETTFRDEIRLLEGSEYSISYRAKWLTGNSQLNSRLYFNRNSNTNRLDIPLSTGTPGAPNSTRVDNIGPTYDDFGHSPVLPTSEESVTVHARPSDPDGVETIRLWWRSERDAWNSVEMVDRGDGLYEGTIPPQPFAPETTMGPVVQFYVESTDTLGAVSTFPADGTESRALYQISDDRGPSTEIDRYQIILHQDEADLLFASENRMSNRYRRMTMLYEGRAYYDVDVRQVGSRWIRPNSGYKVKFDPADRLYGVHDTIRFDLNGLPEIVMKQMLNRSGGHSASNYDDLSYLVSPRHNQEVILQLARYESIFLNEQFENGTDGTKWELDDVTYPTQPVGGREGPKVGTDVYTEGDIGIKGQIVVSQGENPEFYRAHLLIKNNRAKDDFNAIKDLAHAIHNREDMKLFESAQTVMDVDLWMRHYANQSYFGNWDTYGFRRPKNLRIYQRPDDGKFIPLFWDCDLCNFNEIVKTRRQSSSRLDEIRDVPHNLRTYWGHLYDYVNSSFTEAYVTEWAERYGRLVNYNSYGGDEQFKGIATSTAHRNIRVMSDMEKDIPRVDFQITTNDGNHVTVDTSSIQLTGKGWVDIRQLRIVGTETPLDVFWPETDSWQVDLPLANGPQEIAIEAIGFRGDVIATDSIVVTSTGGSAVLGSLRLTEINYNPGSPTEAEAAAGHNDKDDFDYLEFTNVGDQAIALTDVTLVTSGEEGVEFVFAASEVTELAAGAAVVVVEDLEAFRARYGSTPLVAGQYDGGLGNANELITVLVGGDILHQVRYDDTWHPTTDGEGRSLQIIDPHHPDLSSWSERSSWRPSAVVNGTPGVSEAAVGDANLDGRFDERDLVAVFETGKYEDGIANNSTFADGDFNGDGDVTSEDLVWAFTYGRYEPQTAPSRSVDRAFSQVSSSRSSLWDDTDTLPPHPTLQDRDRKQEVDSVFGNNDSVDQVSDLLPSSIESDIRKLT